ncbi:MAG: YibE/F family protein [Anaeromicrobium sp.]|jgi:uncharacterized membrane protein|uniref:YibE/F family protein n=1 Tax=Anaeromicrobium sp. TaxID=1929132 RepID=UPI0025F8070C|nr:YibE/F family protein [Anaeromicrobium sp.]MCT4592840.1 YibE/F family protein [Anaeromicrobium sp.]
MKKMINDKKYKIGVYGIAILIMVVVGFMDLGSEYYGRALDKRGETVDARVIKMYLDDRDDKESKRSYRTQEFEVEITSGDHRGETYVMRNTIETMDVYNIEVEVGENIVLTLMDDENSKVENLHIYDKSREIYIYLFVCFFFVILLVIGGKSGFKSIFTLIFTGFMIVKLLIPLVLKGYNPILITIMTCSVIIAITLLIIGDMSKKTLSAIIGTLGGVIVAGVLAMFVGNLCKITGLADEDMQSLVYMTKNYNMNFKGILFSAIIIGALGAVMDVSISIGSSMFEIKSIKPDINKANLFKSGMNIGKDIMGSMANTLILAYTGGAMQLMLFFLASGATTKEIVNLEMAAVEIIRALSGSIGLAATIPITAISVIMIDDFFNDERKKK